jgi:hypothetical protein
VSKGKTSRSHLTGVRLSDCDSVTTPRGENHDGCMHRDDTVRHLLRSIRCTQPTQARVLLSVSFFRSLGGTTSDSRSGQAYNVRSGTKECGGLWIPAETL